MTLSGGSKLRDTLNKLKDLAASRSAVHVGFLEGSTCGQNNDASSPEIAYILEMGAPKAGIPPRPFFRSMIDNNSGTWGSTLLFFLKQNDYDAHAALSGLGLIMGEQLQFSITMTTEPPNKPGTVRAKGFDKPLEWSKNMKHSIEFEVDGERSLANGSA